MFFDNFINIVKNTRKQGGEITMAIQTVKDLDNSGPNIKEKTDLDIILESYGIDVNLIDYDEYDAIDEKEEILTIDDLEKGGSENET